MIAIDAKTLRGARRAGTAAPHLVGALDHACGTVLAQIAVAARTNEIPAVRDLLTCMNITGAVLTMGALHNQTDTAQAITDAGGDYVFTVKSSKPTLHAACKKLPWSQVPSHRATTTGDRRRGTRTIEVVDAPAWIGFTGAAQVAQVPSSSMSASPPSHEQVRLMPGSLHAGTGLLQMARRGATPGRPGPQVSEPGIRHRRPGGRR